MPSFARAAGLGGTVLVEAAGLAVRAGEGVAEGDASAPGGAPTVLRSGAKTYKAPPTAATTTTATMANRAKGFMTTLLCGIHIWRRRWVVRVFTAIARRVPSGRRVGPSSSQAARIASGSRM